MPLNAQEFVLPGFGGGDPAAGLNAFSNKLWMRGMQTQRLALAKEAKREQAGSFLRQYLDSKDYLSGTQYDPVINSKLQEAMQRGSQLAAQGADIPQLLMALGPQMQEINDYSSKAKAINKQADDAIKTMKESNLVGYDYGRLKEEALKMAFHKKDPKTGQDVGLMDAKDVDPSQNYIFKTLQQHPELVTTGEGVDAFVKNYPQMKRATDAYTYTPEGSMTRNKISMAGQGYLVPETETKNGKTVVTGMVPSYEHATDGGAPLIHSFTNDEGQKVDAPVRLLDEGLFNEAVSHKGVGDWLRGQVSQHLKEYTDRTGKQIDLGSMQAHQVARAIMYDELKRRSPGTIEFLQQLDKPSAAAVNLHLYGDKYQQAYDRRSGTIDANTDAGLTPGGKTPSDKPLNPIETIHQIFKNNPNYLTGDPETINGHSVIDVTANFKNGLVKYGHGQTGTYNHVYFDPGRRVLMMEDANGEISEQGEKGLPSFAKKIAPANGVNGDAVDPSFNNAGYDKKTGTYRQVEKSDEVMGRLNEYQQAVRSNAIDRVIKNDKDDKVKGTKVADGVVTEAGQSGYFTKGKYYVKVKGDNGETISKYFKNEDDLKQYLGGGAPSAPTTQKNSEDSNKSLSDEDLINKFKKQ